MALHEFVIELMERILADPELNITENDIRYFDAGVKLDNSEFQWDEASPLTKNPTIVRNSSLIVRIAFENGIKEFLRFHVGDMYRIYRNDGMDEVYNLFASNYKQHSSRAKSDTMLLGSLHDYDKVKDRVIVRPLNYKLNQDALSRAVYRKYGDIAIVLYLLLDNQETGDHSQLLSTKVPAEILKDWDLDIDTIMDTAVKNTMRLRPPALIGLGDGINFAQHTKFMDNPDLKIDFNSPFAPVVSTDPDLNGAISAFYPGVLERLFKMTGEPFYLVFTNISEFHIHPVSMEFSVSKMRKVLFDVNLRNRIGEILSRELYLYDGVELKMV